MSRTVWGFLSVGVIGVVLFIVLYQKTLYPYHDNVPSGYFDDLGRNVVENDRYPLFLDYMSGTYYPQVKDLQKGIGTGKIDALTEKITALHASGVQLDGKITGDEIELIRALEEEYEDENLLNGLATVLGTGAFGHTQIWYPYDEESLGEYMLEKLRDIPQGERTLTRHISWFAFLHCEIDYNKEKCSEYLGLLERFVDITYRRSTLISSIVNLIDRTYIISILPDYAERFCGMADDERKLRKKIYLDEFNTFFSPLVYGQASWMSEDVNNELAVMFAKIAIRKGSEGFYDIVEGNENTFFDMVLHNKMYSPVKAVGHGLLMMLRVNPVYKNADLISDIYVSALIPRMETPQIGEYIELCNEVRE